MHVMRTRGTLYILLPIYLKVETIQNAGLLEKKHASEVASIALSLMTFLLLNVFTFCKHHKSKIHIDESPCISFCLYLFKVETIGDAYMVASWKKEKHASEVASMALSLMTVAKSFVIPHR